MAGAGGQEVGRISIRVVPDTDGFRRELEAKLKIIEKELSATIGVEVDLDTLKARGDMATLMAKLKAQAANGVTANVSADLDPVKALAKMKALKAALKAEGIEGITLHIDVEKSNLDRIKNSVSKLGDDARNIFTKATDGLWEGGGSAAGGLGSMGRILGIVAAVAALAAPALALVSGVLTAMPAVIAGVLVPIAAIALGLDGIKEAAKIVEPEFKHLKETMSAKFKDAFTPVFTKLKQVFPALEQSMPGVATALGTMAQSFVDVITSDKGLQAIKGTIQNISDTITASAPGLGKLTDGLLGLARGVSAKFPAVGKWLDSVGESFDKWVTKVSSPGVGGGVGGKSPLDTAMENLGGTLKGVLDIIGDLAKQGFDWLSDPKFGDTMKTFVSDCKDLINNVLPGMKQFFVDIAGALHGIVTDIDKIKTWKPDIPGVSAPTEKQTAGKDTTNPFEPFTSDDAPWRKIKDEITISFGETVLLVKTMFSQLWADITTTGSVVWNVIAGAATTAFQSIISIAQTTWDTIVATATTVGSRIGAALGNVGTILSSAWSTLSGVAQIAWNAVVMVVQQAMKNAVAAISDGAGRAVAAVVAMGGQIVSAVTGIDLGAAGRAIMDGFLGGIQAGWEKVKSIVSGMKQWIIDHKGPVSADRVALTPAGTALMQGLQDGIDGGFEGVMSRTRALVQEITDAVNGGFEGVDTSALSDKMKKQLSEIGLESDQLKVDLNGTTDKDAKAGIKDQRSQLQTIKDQLNLQQDQLGFSTKYGDSLEKNDTTMSDSLNKIVDAGKGFAEANIKQFTQDLGISGNGALSSLADQGVGYATGMLSKLISGGLGGGTTINVGSVDDAIAFDRSQTSKKAMQYAPRG